MFQKFEYTVESNRVRIDSFTADEIYAEIPEEIDGYPVAEIGAYAFSGKGIEEVILPKTVKKIGRYAFYNCMNLKSITFCNTMTDLGAGAFTGCHHVREIQVHFVEGKTSILREFLLELPEEQLLCLDYEDGYAELIFPEYFEEAVENTPARILETHTHGSGMLYRNCFVRKELDYRLYDEQFQMAKGREFQRTLYQLIFKRLQYPYHLLEKCKERYHSYLKENLEACAIWAADLEKEDVICYLASEIVSDSEELCILISVASRKRLVVALSFLMDQKHQRFRVKRKTFEL